MKLLSFCLLCCLLSACSTPQKIVTNPRGTFTDERDGQVYQTIKIGDQIWMAQNLNYKTADKSWCYNDDESNRPKYGLFYDFKVLTEACPKGWHIPSDLEWQKLEQVLGMDDSGRELYRGNISGDFLVGGSSGFDVLFAGWHKQGRCADLGTSAYFWTSSHKGTPIYCRLFKKGDDRICRNLVGTAYGMSVRCVKND